ncbi:MULTISPECIES: hypothetical protein [unclassified Ruegeria]|uniref:hypothetical protein n=1 Tax=unclassified Ruegeria TaxID=2625375 RepID=UPI001487EA76|nr:MULTISPECIES: hypothetical protein [unclassified Ruegeria]NOD35939.1 hypothetical protein [Ruegeria sp. HKCCD7296]NOE43331.1 hypothetical protein [Ruegeria sp. HKCCD7319]
MTDNVVKAGIEDVLSSVKRLVSEDTRNKSVSDQQPATKKPGRLVLTDALRVSSSNQANGVSAQADSDSEVSDSAKPMLLRSCDIVQAGKQPANAAQDEPDAPKPARSADAASSLSAKIEALEAAIAQTEDQWEPDGDSEDAYSGTRSQSLPWNVEEEFAAAESIGSNDVNLTGGIEEEGDAHVKAEFIRAPREESEVVAEAADKDRTIDMDEEDLRALIAEVVRQELQGTMGERITRNVRKMVRREIARALAAKELD